MVVLKSCAVVASKFVTSVLRSSSVAVANLRCISGSSRLSQGNWQGNSSHNSYDNSRGFMSQNNSGGSGYSAYGRPGAGSFGQGNRRMNDFNFQQEEKISFENLGEIHKNLYKEHPDVASRSKEDLQKYLQEHQVNLQGKGIPKPIVNFKECPFPEPINKLLSKFDAPTVIQAISWPVALSGRDMVSVARTGSGKTLGFILPAIMHVLGQSKRQRGDGPLVLVLLPTRELAQQVNTVANEFCNAMSLSVTCCYGGAERDMQARALRSGVDICIATPGRMNDFLQRGVTNMRRCSFLVLDEADRMLDMGFEPQIRSIIRRIRPDRQTLMFSATWPKDVRALASDFQKDPVFLNVGSLELAANPNIQQNVEFVEEFGKQSRLIDLVKEFMNETEHKTLIFVGQKRKANDITNVLRNSGINAMAIHGDKQQAERDYVLNSFRSGRAQILIATDVAARGLDVTDIKYVVNYDYPNNSEDYVHRIGRTGRGNRKGTSYTFFTSGDMAKASDLIKVLVQAKQKVPQQLERGNSGSAFGYY